MQCRPFIVDVAFSFNSPLYVWLFGRDVEGIEGGYILLIIGIHLLNSMLLDFSFQPLIEVFWYKRVQGVDLLSEQVI